MSLVTHCPACERNARDKPTWGPGPWQNEPDRIEFEHAGLPCILHRGGFGGWCGYVGIAPGHPLHGKQSGSDEAEAIDVHGGLTYAASCHGHVCHVPKPGEPGEPDDLWWLGFDCMHAFDFAPESVKIRNEYMPAAPDLDEHYWTVEEVKAETMRLADQLAAYPR